MRRGLLIIVALTSACGGNAEPGDSTEGAVGPAADGSAPTVESNMQADPAEGPAEIYFDLTRHSWYLQAQPLMHEGRGYEPQGEPIAAPADSLEKVGRYQGVDYYARLDAREPLYTLYVPVYYQYWQRFTAPPGRQADGRGL